MTLGCQSEWIFRSDGRKILKEERVTRFLPCGLGLQGTSQVGGPYGDPGIAVLTPGCGLLTLEVDLKHV